MTFTQCRDQCERVGLVMPKNNAGVQASKNTGCNINGRKMWVDVLGGGSVAAPTELDVLEPTVKYATNGGGAGTFTKFNTKKYGGSLLLRGDKDKSTENINEYNNRKRYDNTVI